ncbi:thiolase family protein [Paraburkholderia fynbosensis]|uniref:Acetyl-CoA acetyltransferase n=1 Tax=Paraburkholderia fynbosensis TaxID=1200993 RepID=A0A6J5H2F3_9BURK|nr:thiolase family protein [Paraburkholderia fynbosensis]CAB3810475.1 Acetyl-CoA acetyltransferase [Paraburkholderia fynbosensis]
MKFDNAYIPGPLMWSSPFIRWQRAAADLNSLDMAAQVTRDALDAREFDRERVGQLIYGTTVPQRGSFYAGPLVAARSGLPNVGGPTISQACATSVACVAQAAAQAQLNAGEVQLVVTSDRVSNGPLMIYPSSSAMGGGPNTENWVLDNFVCDPWTGESMVHTAEATARDGGFTREQCDELTLLRFNQYQHALADDRRIQRRYMQPILVPGRKTEVRLEEDDGVSPYSVDGLRGLRPSLPGGVTTPGTQTHPADGTAGLVVSGLDEARALAAGEGVSRLLSAGFCRAEKGRMPKAPALAAQRALASAGVSIDEVKVVVTHNPFAVNDLWFAKALGFPLEKMNPYGCSLIYGHPQGPTGMRGIVELVHALREQGGGVGLFTGCAAGDMGAALLLRVE